MVKHVVMQNRSRVGFLCQRVKIACLNDVEHHLFNGEPRTRIEMVNQHFNPYVLQDIQHRKPELVRHTGANREVRVTDMGRLVGEETPGHGLVPGIVAIIGRQMDFIAIGAGLRACHHDVYAQFVA